MTRKNETHTKRHTLIRSSHLTSYLALPLILGLFFVPMIGAEAATVCPVGSNPECDYPTIQAAIDDTTGDTTITIMKSPHTERGIIVSRSGVTIQGQSAEDGETGSTVIQACGDAVCPKGTSIFTINMKQVLTIKNVTITKGNASKGGAIFNSHKGTLTVINSTISGNTAVNGGGIYSDGGNRGTTIKNCTITQNVVTGSGGGLYLSSSQSGYASTFQNSIIAGNKKGGVYNNCYVNSTVKITSDGYNIIGVRCYKDNINSPFDPLVDVVLEEYDFNDLFAYPYPNSLTNGVYPLDGEANPADPTAIDQIPNDADNGCGTQFDDKILLSKDQLGIPRPINVKCDIGAVEYKPPLIVKMEKIIRVNSDEEKTYPITKDNLLAEDLGTTPDNSIIFEVTELPSHGNLKLDDEGVIKTLKKNDTFTQAHINAGNLLTYTHNSGSKTTSNFKFTVSASGESKAKTFIIKDGIRPKLTAKVLTDTIDQDQGTFSFEAQMSEPGKVYYMLSDAAVTVDEIKIKNSFLLVGSEVKEEKEVENYVSGQKFYVVGVDDAENNHSDEPRVLVIDTKVTLTINRLGEGSGSVKSTDGFIDCGIKGTICTYKYDQGTNNISLSASAASGSYFVEWTSAECSKAFTIQDNMDCSATFNAGSPPPPPPPPVDPLPPEMTFKVTINGIGKGDIRFTPYPEEKNCNADETQCDYTFKTAEFVTITVTPENGSFFNGWAEGSEGECPESKAVETEEGGSKIERIFMTENKHCVVSLKLHPKNLTIASTGEGSGSVITNPTGTPCDIGDCITFDGGLEITLIPEPAPDSVFNSWQGHEDCRDGKVTMMINKTCTAQFDLKPQYTLTLISEGADGKLGSTLTSTNVETKCDTSPCTINYYEGAPITLNGYADEPDDFYIDEWKGDGCTEGKVTLDGNKTCTGNFGPRPTFNLTLQIIGEGRVERTPSERATCGDNCFSYLAGTVTLQIFLSGDSQDYLLGDNCSNRQMVMDSDQICTVTFTKEIITPPPDDDTEYKLSVALGGTGTGSVTSEPAGIDCGIDCSENYPKDIPVTLIATPADGSQFDGWSESCPDGKVTAGHNSVISCIARFRLIPTYILTVKKSGSGSGTIISEPAGIIDCDGNCPETSYQSNTPIEVAFLIKPAPGSVFKGWIGDCREDGSVTLDRNKVCTGIFDGFGTLQFSSITPTVEINEDRGAVSLTVNRIKGSSGEVSVKYTTADGTAKAGTDYTTSTGILTWQTGKSEPQTITIPINLDKEPEENETFSLTLSEPTGGSVLGTHHKLDITIIHVPWFSSLQFVMSNYSVNESDGIVKLLVTRAGSSQSSLTVDYSTKDESATANSDYTPISNTLTWADGDRKPKPIEIPVLHDNLAEEKETFVVELSNITGDAQLGTNQKATVTIINTPGAGNLEFSAAEYSVKENQLQLKISVKRVGGKNGAVSVQYASHEGSAGAVQDYSAVNGTLNWFAENVETKEIIVPITADQLGEEEENFTLTLSEATGGASLGAIATTTVKIINTDNSGIDTSPNDPSNPDNPDDGVSASAGILQLGVINYQVDEGDDSIEITVSRTQGSQGTVAINYATQDETALADQDYQTANGKLEWANGDTEDKHFSVSIIDDNIVEESERFKVTLSEPEGAELGNNIQAAIEINDDDTSISLDSNTYKTDGSTSVLVTISRHGNTSEIISVDYTTNDGTAKADKDYIATAGTIEWGKGQYYDQTVMISLMSSGEVNDKAKQLTFNLTNVSDKATLDIPSKATVIISSNLCDEVGQSIACTVIADDKDAPLSNVEIASNGLVVGATLGGDIKNQGELRDIKLLPDTQVSGGRISGKVSGDPENPARFSNVYIAADATVQYVIIADGSTVDPRAKLGKGVTFEDNSSIPKNVELGDLLGRKPKAIFGRKAANLTKDMLYNGAIGGILGAINSLPALTISGFTLTQDAESGYLMLDIGNLRIAVLPTQVKQSTVKKVTQDMPMGLYITPNHQVTFITHTAREIIAHPVIQAPAFFNEELGRFNLNEPAMSEDGNFQIVINEGASIMARAAAFALQVPKEIPLGISTLATPVPNVVNVSFVFEDKEGNNRQQFIYSAAADPEALLALSPNKTDIVLEFDGRARLQVGGNLYKGLLDYVVTTGNPPTATTQILDIGDINADGCNDYRINYPKGESQILYCQ